MFKLITLIPEWKNAWKMFSVQAQVLAITVITLWEQFPPLVQESVPKSVVVWILVAGTIGRLLKQKSVSGETP